LAEENRFGVFVDGGGASILHRKIPRSEERRVLKTLSLTGTGKEELAAERGGSWLSIFIR